MDKTSDIKRFEATYAEKSKRFDPDNNLNVKRHMIASELSKELSVTSVESPSSTDSSLLVLEKLAWFHQLNDVPDSYKPLFDKDGSCSLGQWMEISLNERTTQVMPSEVIDHLVKSKVKFGIGKLN
jgi:hypothetical protein